MIYRDESVGWLFFGAGLVALYWLPWWVALGCAFLAAGVATGAAGARRR